MEPSQLKIKYVPPSSRYTLWRTPDYENIPTEITVKEIINFYKAFIGSLEREFGEQSDQIKAFKVWYRDCKTCRITVIHFRQKIYWLLKNKLDLTIMFFNTVLPYLYPLSLKNEVDRANQFIQRVKSAFPENGNHCAKVYISIWWFQYGESTLEQMTAGVLEVVGNRDDLIKAYLEFVPRAQEFISNGNCNQEFISNGNCNHTLS